MLVDITNSAQHQRFFEEGEDLDFSYSIRGRPGRWAGGLYAGVAVASVAAEAGAEVKKGDLLLTIEAMKMETGLHAERDAVVKAMHVQPGGQIDAKDLLVELE